MSPLWILPLIVVAVGFAVLAVTARGLAAAARSAAAAVDDLRLLGTEAVAVRHDADAVLQRGLALAESRARASSTPRADQ